MIYFSVLIFFLISVETCKSIPLNSSVIYKYPTVSKWGTSDITPSEEEARSSNSRGTSVQTISSTTKKKNPAVVYHYPVYQNVQPKIEKRIEHVPGIGEVIVQSAQDRFEARPLFAYKNKLAATYGPPATKAPANSSPPAPPAPSSPQPPAQPPVLPPSSSILAPLPKPPSSLYDSPFSSYNPPDFTPDNSQIDQYPPFSVNNDPGVLAAPPAPMESSPSSSEKTTDQQDSYASLGPPLAPYGNSDDDSHDYEHHNYHYNVPAEDPMAMYKNNDGPPNYPPKNLEDIYYPPDFPKDQIDHGMKAEDDHSAAPASMSDQKEQNNNSDDMDLSPPPAHNYGHSFPDYLYDQHHYDHHVYEEIPHTTMPPAKEDKRVSSTHYSYYLLGRKLWYIPLYFSVYFIIYVTVLIVKSIARHKVNLKYKWYEHDINAKQARSFDLDNARKEQISDIHENVSTAIKNITEKITAM